jgi:flagellum-specific ATP synthase
VEGDDLNEPVSDAVRSIVDGHIVLKRSIAHQGHYPAIDVLESISRLMKDISKADHIDFYKKLINVLSTYRRVEDLINLGAYIKGSNPEIDFAIQKIEAIKLFLRQDVNEKINLEDSINQLKGIFK